MDWLWLFQSAFFLEHHRQEVECGVANPGSVPGSLSGEDMSEVEEQQEWRKTHVGKRGEQEKEQERKHEGKAEEEREREEQKTKRGEEEEEEEERNEDRRSEQDVREQG